MISRGKKSMLKEYMSDAVEWRRSLHRCPQPAWLEFYATAFVAEKLASWGYELKMGRDIIKEGEQLLLPSEETLQAEFDRALKAGGKIEYLERSEVALPAWWQPSRENRADRRSHFVLISIRMK